MTWLIVGAAVAAVAGVALLLRREMLHAQEGDGVAALVAPLRLVNGVLLIMALLLVAVGVAFVLPRADAVGQPSVVMIAYWIFILLLMGAIVLLALLDVVLVRRGFQRRQDQVLREALLGKRSSSPRGTAHDSREDPGRGARS